MPSLTVLFLNSAACFLTTSTHRNSIPHADKDTHYRPFLLFACTLHVGIKSIKSETHAPLAIVIVFVKDETTLRALGFIKLRFRKTTGGK